jgi:hypothetical protein
MGEAIGKIESQTTGKESVQRKNEAAYQLIQKELLIFNMSASLLPPRRMNLEIPLPRLWSAKLHRISGNIARYLRDAWN